MSKSYQEMTVPPAYKAPQYGERGEIVNGKEGGDPIWANAAPPPAIGTKINVNMNSLGEATVLRYFVEHGYLGLLVQFSNPPAWYTKQNKGNPPGHIFGPEFKPLEKGNG